MERCCRAHDAASAPARSPLRIGLLESRAQGEPMASEPLIAVFVDFENLAIGVREMKDVVESIELMGSDGEQVARIPRDALDFRYRSLAGLEPNSIIVAARPRATTTITFGK